MKRTFATEDHRKTALFNSWIEHLQWVHSHELHFDEVYEGQATVERICGKRIDLRLEDGRLIQQFPTVENLSSQQKVSDAIYIVIGRVAGAWWMIDVISIGSVVDERKGEIHLTINPLHYAAFRDLHSFKGDDDRVH